MDNTEETLLRELAGGRCTIQKVIDAWGPMSLWSKAGLEAEIQKAVLAEREACAQVCYETELRFTQLTNKYFYEFDAGGADAAKQCAVAIRARGQA